VSNPEDSAVETSTGTPYELGWSRGWRHQSDILKALRNNETVGILMDQNTVREEGVFAKFFGIPALASIGDSIKCETEANGRSVSLA
jgi:hypothetical protein